MFLYPRSILFALPAELSHRISFLCLRHLPQLSRLYRQKLEPSPIKFGGCDFPNQIGLAAGLDKNADCIPAWFAMGFGHIEVGTVTLNPQPGNPGKRLFRLRKDQALINRFGFNSRGVNQMVLRLQQYRKQTQTSKIKSGIIGVNIGKNYWVSNKAGAYDYATCMQKVAPYADYITINISSPNTKNLRDYHQADAIKHLLNILCEQRAKLQMQNNKYLPLWLKLSPDCQNDELIKLLETVKQYPIDALVASNTTITRNNLISAAKKESGGLSGSPLRELSNQLLQKCKMQCPDIPVVGVGGISSSDDARAKIDLGAELVQLYTGFIYQGPRLIKAIHEELSCDINEFA